MSANNFEASRARMSYHMSTMTFGEKTWQTRLMFDRLKSSNYWEVYVTDWDKNPLGQFVPNSKKEESPSPKSLKSFISLQEKE